MLALSPKTEAPIRAEARASGKSADELLRGLFEPAAVPTPKQDRPDILGMKAAARRAAALPIHDTRSEKEITDEGWGL